MLKLVWCSNSSDPVSMMPGSRTSWGVLRDSRKPIWAQMPPRLRNDKKSSLEAHQRLWEQMVGDSQ